MTITNVKTFSQNFVTVRGRLNPTHLELQLSNRCHEYLVCHFYSYEVELTIS